MIPEILGLVLWTGIIGMTCFLSYRRKVKRDVIFQEMLVVLQRIEVRLNDDCLD